MKLTEDQIDKIRNSIFQYGIGEYVSLEFTIKEVFSVIEKVANIKLEFDKTQES